MNLTVCLGLKEHADELINLLTEKRHTLESAGRQSKYSCLIQDCFQPSVTDGAKWKDFSDFSAEELSLVMDKDVQTDGSTQLYNSKDVADEIHDIADSLPTYGVTLDVYLWPLKANANRDDSSYIHYLGSLRRFKDWHNAKFTIIEAEPTEDTEFLQRFLSSSVCLNVQSVQMTEEVELWRGKVSICNKIENSGLTIPGVCMYRLENHSSTLHFPLMTVQDQGKRQLQTLQEGRVGRMLEVLDEINLSSVSALMKTPYSYKMYP